MELISMDGRKRNRLDQDRLIQRRVIPALLTSVSLVILIYLLHIFSIGIETGLGSSAVIFASFAASAFLLFMTPHMKAASPKRFVKSYIIGALMGYLGYVLITVAGLYVAIFVVMPLLALFLIMFDAEHPPGAGIAFAFLLYRVGWVGIIVVIVGVAIMLFMRYVLERAVYIVEEDFEKREKGSRR